MVTNSELVFWIVSGVLAILFSMAVPSIRDYLDYREVFGNEIAPDFDEG